MEAPSYSTARLVMRALQTPLDDKHVLDLFGSDEPGQFGWTDEPVVPYTPKKVEEFHKAMEKATVAIMICLPDDDKDEDGRSTHEGSVTKPGKAVGMMALHPIRHPHRRADFGIAIHRDHQGQGFAREALEWLLERAFIGYGLHRVQGSLFAYNERALRAYTSLGFTVEGRRREAVWSQGQFYDDIQIGILASEWLARRQNAKG
ncbi:hypothetical protein JCM3766R1_000550 [Sporobolomyces carnicolor]